MFRFSPRELLASRWLPLAAVIGACVLALPSVRTPLDDVMVTGTHTTDDGVPDETSFLFAKDLDSGYVFRKWEGRRLAPFEPPAIGQTFTFAGRMPDLLP